jgi:LmbE family N-acetylglucosaminyl deacetylase
MASPLYPGGMPVEHETRELETECAMEILGCEWEQWPIMDDYPSGWEDDLAGHLRSLDSEIIFAPAVELGGHQQHNVIGELARAIFGDHVQHYLTYTSKGRSTEGEEVVCADGWLDIKRQAMACYRSQAEHPATRHWFEQEDLREFVL